jgi:hypothetical protein
MKATHVVLILYDLRYNADIDDNLMQKNGKGVKQCDLSIQQPC